MTALESPDYQTARDRMKGNPIIATVAAASGAGAVTYV